MRNLELYFENFFKAASNDGVIFINFTLKEIENIDKFLFKRLQMCYTTLDSFFILKQKDSYDLLLGRKSVIGYNEELVEFIKVDIRCSLHQKTANFKSLRKQIDFFKKINKLKQFVLKQKHVNLYFSTTKRFGVSRIYDEIVIGHFDYSIGLKIFENAIWSNKFIPIVTNNYSFAIINLIKLDFLMNDLYLNNTKILRKTNNGEYIFYMTVDQYMIEIPQMIEKKKEEFGNQLYFLNFNNILIINSPELKDVFKKPFLLPVFYEER